MDIQQFQEQSNALLLSISGLLHNNEQSNSILVSNGVVIDRIE